MTPAHPGPLPSPLPIKGSGRAAPHPSPLPIRGSGRAAPSLSLLPIRGSDGAAPRPSPLTPHPSPSEALAGAPEAAQSMGEDCSYSCRADPGRCWEPGGNWGKIDFRESKWECVNQPRQRARQHSHVALPPRSQALG